MRPGTHGGQVEAARPLRRRVLNSTARIYHNDSPRLSRKGLMAIYSGDWAVGKGEKKKTAYGDPLRTVGHKVWLTWAPEDSIQCPVGGLCETFKGILAPVWLTAGPVAVSRYLELIHLAVGITPHLGVWPTG